MLKKTCWSRDKNVLLKKNVYNPDDEEQEFRITYFDSRNECIFDWTDSAIVPKELNSIYVFDSKCAFIYINNENPIEYKPIGLDVLERLIDLFNEITEKIDTEINKLKTVKPILDNKYSSTKIFTWYTDLLNKKREEISSKIVFTEDNKKRLEELTKILAKTDPVKENNELSQKILRYNIIKKNLLLSENATSAESIKNYDRIRQDYTSKKNAYKVASEKFKGADPLEGVGSDTWRILWEAASNYAITEIHPEHESFPTDLSSVFCVLCQQPLEAAAVKRLIRFESYISDTTNTEMQKSKEIFDDLLDSISSLDFEYDTDIDELDTEIKNFKNDIIEFQGTLELIKSEIISNLKTEKPIQLTSNLKVLSKIVEKRVSEIDAIIKSNALLISSKQTLVNEQLELTASEFLFINKDQVKDFFEEGIKKYWLNQAKAKANTRIISLKIGEIQETNAIQEQHKEFINHLTSLNKELAQKVVLKKTRTTQGSTFQKCALQGLNEPLSEILSEGEQKVLAISNFVAECTIDGSKNSIVFDDPVSSLDQNYKEDISSLITKLSANRQVIVFTHDLNFVRSLVDDYTKLTKEECSLIGLKYQSGFSGIITDEIPYLAKNIQERIDTIRRDLKEIDSLKVTQVTEIEEKTELVSKRMRFLLEKTVEDVLSNKTIQRFSKNISFKARQLSSYVVTEKKDIDFLLGLFGKYSIPEHDGGLSTVYQNQSSSEIAADLKQYEDWKKDFKQREKTFIEASGYK
jgi:energy-coupling factor transporter ATP-binding protein EcfA2